jgi:hypothetical protein
MIRHLFRIASFVILAIVPAVAQDPTRVAPNSYKLQFENDFVKVLRVHYPASQKVPLHDHSKYPAAYVYLNDSGPINFKHAEWDHPILTRPAVSARSFRLSRTRFQNERHEVENANKRPSDFFRIEIKTVPDTRHVLNGRFRPESYAADRNYTKVHFENAQLRVSRIAVAPNHQLTISAPQNEPILLVSFENAPKLGDTVWIDGGTARHIANTSSAPIEFLRFDLKSQPFQRATR